MHAVPLFTGYCWTMGSLYTHEGKPDLPTRSHKEVGNKDEAIPGLIAGGATR